MARLGNKLRCTLCLEEIDYLENPKQLPCTHVYCLLCLESKVQSVESGGLQFVCSICSKKHSLNDLADLPAPTQEDQSNQDNSLDAVSDASTPVVSSQYPDSESAPAQCDKCKTKGVDKEAVCYCADCDRKLCSHHNQLHDDYFDDGGGRHCLVDIKKYLAKPGVYTKPKCELHGYDIGVCCEKCFCLRCARCKTQKQCHDGVAHVFHTLEDTEPKLKSEFAVLLKECAKKLTEMCKLEKETWLELDGFEEECRKLLDQVEAKEKELVSAVLKRSNRFKEYISHCQQKKSRQVEEYLENMRLKKDEMEQSRLKCELLLRNHHVTEIIKQREERITDLKKAKMDTLTKHDFSGGVINRTLEKFLELDITLHPDTLDLVSTHSMPDTCYSVRYTEEGDILASGESGLYLYTKSSDYRESTCLHTGLVNCAVKLGTTIWYVASIGDWEYVKTTDLAEQETYADNGTDIFKFKGNGQDIVFLTVCDKWIIATDTLKKGIIVYDRENEKRWDKNLHFRAKNVYVAANGSLLVTGGDALRKYSLESTGEMVILWQSPKLSNAFGVAEGKDDRIIVKGNSTRHTYTTLYTLSKKGELLSSKEYRDLEGTDYGIGISVDGESLLVPSGPCFKVFNLL